MLSSDSLRQSLIEVTSARLGKRPKPDDEDDEDAPARTVAEDYEAIDMSNIIPRSKRRSALASGLARPLAKPTSSSSSSGGVSGSKPRPSSKPSKSADSDTDEAEF